MTGVGDSISGERLAPAARSRAFRNARRHSRWVRFFKLAIPLGSAIAVAGVSLIAIFDPFRKVEGLSVGPISVSGSKVTMESPRLTGFKDDSRPYEVTASAALQDVRKPNLVELKDLKARIVTDDKGGAARLEASAGVLDTQKEQMELHDNIKVRTESGQEVRLQSASVNFKAGTVVSQEPVTVSLGNGVIQAAGVEVEDNGKILRFKGRVQTTFDGTSAPAGSSPKTSFPASTVTTPPSAEPMSFR